MMASENSSTLRVTCIFNLTAQYDGFVYEKSVINFVNQVSMMTGQK